MLEFTAVPRRVRRDTLVNAYIDWVSYGREDARATFSDAYGQQINWRCSIEHHIDAARTPLQRPPTPQNEDKGTENISCSDDQEKETNGGEADTGDPRDSPSSVQSSSDSENTANERWDNRGVNSSEDTKDDEFDLDGAPGWEEWGAPPPAKERWGPHCEHKYGTTNTEYKNTAWRYDVVTDVEIYRVSTMPNDFIGSSPWNNWTHEVLVAYHMYKEVDHMSEELEHAAKVLSADEADSRNDFHRTRYEAAVRAATLRIEFLRKWPNAFEQHDGTFNHWERALELLQRAERARLDGLQAFENWPRTCFEHQDRPDVPVSATSNLRALGVETMSAVAFASLHTNDGLENTALGEAVRLSLEQCYIAKFRAVTYINYLRTLLLNPGLKVNSFSRSTAHNYAMLRDPLNICASALRQAERAHKGLLVPREENKTDAADADGILNVLLSSPNVRKLTRAKLVPETDFKNTPIDKHARLGKPVFAISPQQYKLMRSVNDINKADLRRLLNEQEDPASLEDNRWAYTIDRRPEAGYPDLPELKPELECTYNPEDSRMECSEKTFRRLAGFWPDETRLGFTTTPKC